MGGARVLWSNTGHMSEHTASIMSSPSCFPCPHSPWRHTQGPAALTVCSNQGLDALPAPLAQSVDHEKQQGQDEEGGDATNDQTHPTGHGVEQAVPIC